MPAEAEWRQSVFSVAALVRFAIYLALWLILIGCNVTDLVIGMATAAWATIVSILLLPVSDRQISPFAFAKLCVRLPWQSLVAGADVARRALDPRLPLQPGFITYATGLADGPGRNAFRAIMSLQPGTLPVSVAKSGVMLIHCLDTSQPIVAQLADEEASFLQLTKGGAKRPKQNG
jgi:multicomponent Na+:H+ antiporter subunit E